MSQIVINGDNIEVLKSYPDNHFDSVVTDPPYGLGKEPDALDVLRSWADTGFHEVKGSGFMGKEWDAFVPQPLFWKEVFRVLKHGGHVLAFYGTRTYDWGVMAMRVAGFEVRDTIYWHYGSGFPKSHNISKAIDKLHGAEREIIGEKKHSQKGIAIAEQRGAVGGGAFGQEKIAPITIPATDEAKQWEGWGTALKPASEPIVVARKPIEKGLSVAENVIKYGTGGINIDGCRVKTEDDLAKNYNSVRKSDDELGERGYKMGFRQGKDSYAQATESTNMGRFPANIILTHCNYQVMNLVGNLDNSKLAEIIRYFYGYTKVFDLRERKRSATKQDKCGDEVLQSRMQKDCKQKKSNSKKDRSQMPELSNDFYSNDGSLSEREEKILQSELQRPTSKIDEGRESNKIREKTYGGIEEEDGGNKDKKRYNTIEGEASELEGGQNESSRICKHNDFNTPNGLARNGEENATKSNIHFGASDSNGDGDEKTAIGFGECSPYKRDKERQQTEQFSNRGQSESFQEASGNRCGNGEIAERKPILEVLDFDVPTEWLRYFEYTGENLGCECRGIKKISSDSHHTTKYNGKKTLYDGGWEEGEDMGNKFADADGKETIEDWICHEDCPIKIMDEQSGVSKSSDTKRNRNTLGSFGMPNDHTPEYNDKGGASRFFYCAKASKSERNKGLDEFEEKIMKGRDEGQDERSVAYKPIPTPMANIHPTVKPVKLMQYLVRLVTPPNGLVLDPFCGSGTTGIACKLEGFQFVGIEQDAEYTKIAQARIAKFDGGDEPQTEPNQEISDVKEVKPKSDLPIQTSLF